MHGAWEAQNCSAKRLVSLSQRCDENLVTRAMTIVFPHSSRTNTDHCLPRTTRGRVKGGHGIIQGRNCADVRPQSSIPHPLNDLAQLGAIGLDNEIDSQTVYGPRLDRSDDGHQRSSGSNQARGPLPDVAADEIKHQIDAANVFQNVVLEIDEFICAEVECLLTIGGALANKTSVSLSDLSEQPYLDRVQCEFRTRVNNHLRERAIIMVPQLKSEREDLIQQAVAEGAGVCMLPERSAIVGGLALRPVETLNLSRAIAFRSISGSGTAAALRQLRVLIERYAWS
jgi:hypothetical protein